MKKMAATAALIVIFIMVISVAALASNTNLGALASAAISIFDSPANKADAYEYGECTYWVALRRIQIGEPIPNTWGNAITWAERAARDNYLVNHAPSYGAIMQDPNSIGGLGHVAFVEKVNPLNGSWTISEMNRVGWDEVDTRTLSASDAAAYNFIHNQSTL